ncbi:Eco57I restriction-modification methylase domain-containing protein [Lewinella sp. JB7]|uniref:Eco57I restriction-modification methylase domain-containing protein n=1 Tax=Lewinella sp. JB7 TaxID=2962887 RepID=UPI0020C9D994|nr:N-6 DNA methylase [Lewinella sp. JB7]MCP9237919.1 SAM-dependent methyltransferase [Lewinella sp. JB7]
MSKSVSKTKRTGATFTPPSLAKYLSEQILRFAPKSRGALKILDPACGDGELLVAVGKLLSLAGRTFTLYGFDINLNYVTICRERLAKLDYNHEVKCCDFLLEGDPPTVDIVVANPPYVRTQVLGEVKAQQLAEKYNLKGRVDLYYPFLIEMTHCLAQDGIIGVITSNRYLHTKGGESIRSFLATSFHIDRVVDLGDTKLFESAAVLPAIFIGRRQNTAKKSIQQATYLKIYQEIAFAKGQSEFANIYEVLTSEETGLFEVGGKVFKQSRGQLTTNQRDSNWQLLTAEEIEWVKQVQAACPYTIRDLARVRVGVKTTADNVFIRNDWDELPSDIRPETEVLHDIVSQKDIERWQAPSTNSTQILYTHEDHKGKKRVVDFSHYPLAQAYLATHRQQLEGRSYVIKAKREWYEIWVPQKPRLWKHPKLVFPDISEKARFHLDEGGAIVNGNCYWISQDDVGSVDWLLLMQGMTNSDVMATYHDLCFNNRLYAGRRRYLSQYVENYPIPDLGTPGAQKIVSLVKQLNEASKVGRDITELESRLNDQINDLLGLTSSVAQGLNTALPS